MGTIFLFLFMLGNLGGGVLGILYFYKDCCFLFWDVVKFLRNILILLGLIF